MENQMTKSISKELNATLPTFKELVKTLAGHELCTRIVHPTVWACGYDDKKIISIAMNQMCMQMQGIPFSEINGEDEYLCKDHRGNQYPFSGEDYECLLKIMFCSWMQIGIIDDNNAELYYEFKSIDNVWKVLD
jgi:hypothetical protein